MSSHSPILGSCIDNRPVGVWEAANGFANKAKHRENTVNYRHSSGDRTKCCLVFRAREPLPFGLPTNSGPSKPSLFGTSDFTPDVAGLQFCQ